MSTSNLPRNARARNANGHRKKAATKEINRSTKELDTICDKHKIGVLTFRSCKLASEDGKVTFVENEFVRGNMKSGIVVLRAGSVHLSDSVYDVVEIKKNKLERDEKNKQEELEQIRVEMDRMNEEEEAMKHQELLNKLDSDTNECLKECTHKCTTDCINECTHNCKHECTHDCIHDCVNECSHSCSDPECTYDCGHDKIKPAPSKIEPAVLLPQNPRSTFPVTDESAPSKVEDSGDEKQKSKVNVKRDKAIKQMQSELNKKAVAKEGNKFYRNFMKDIKGKFSFQEQSEFYFFEVQVNSTEMVIANAKVQKFVMPANTKETYMLIIGDLQMKSSLIKQIDPAYRSDNVFRDQRDFLERIKASEKVKTMESPEDLIEDEIDALGIPDLVPIDDQQLGDLMNPELLNLRKSLEATEATQASVNETM